MSSLLTEIGFAPDAITVDEATGCWLWQGAMAGSQPTIRDRGQPVSPRRLAYERLVGPLPPAWTLRPTCARTRCINPVHQIPVMRPANSQRRGPVQAEVATWLPAERPPQVTERSWTVLNRLAAGQLPARIAADLGLSRQRIYQIVNQARRKLAGDAPPT